MAKARARRLRNIDPGPMRIDLVPLSELVEWPGNPKTHDIDGITESMKRHGYVDLIVVDEGTGKIPAGHGRREALLAMKARGDAPPDRVEVRADGEWMVPVLRGIDFGKPEEAEAYLLGSNRLVERGGYDLTKLREVLDRHKSNTLGTGWKPGDLDEAVRRAKEVVARIQKQTRLKTSQDEDPSEPKSTPTSRTGDLWKLGDHLLLCGDATDRDSYRQLLG
ncbi:MAG: hypothetical protein L3K06_06975, partial [Thermoplasmata archaeon]|nr:hypothetical protein [Thermoplasmata archaeon]